MQRISRAPELSATLSLVSCWITSGLHAACAAAGSASSGPLQDLEQAPALGPRKGPRLDHAHDVALLCRVRLVVGPQPAGAANHLLVGGMAADHGDLDRDRLVPADRDDRALANLLRPRLAGPGGRPGTRFAPLAPAGGPGRPAPPPPAPPALA